MPKSAILFVFGLLCLCALPTLAIASDNTAPVLPYQKNSPPAKSSAQPTFLLFRKDGAALQDLFGKSVAGIGDVNGDGKADFIIGAPGTQQADLQTAGSAFVYSGADGSLLFQNDGAALQNLFGTSVAGAGDVNGDGKADFIIGAYGADPGGISNAGSAYIYSGADGSLLFQKDGAALEDQFGTSVAGAGDVNGDGKADFIIGVRLVFSDAAGSAFVYSGADGSLLFQKNGAASDLLGNSVAGVCDINEDGKADFIIGAPGADPAGIQAAGSAFVYSGADGSLLFRKDGAAPQRGLGSTVASAGDVNADGKADFIVGAPSPGENGIAYPAVFIYSGADGSLLFQKNGAAAGDELGWSVAGAGDVNGDGKADFIISSLAADPGGLSFAGSVYVYSGADGSLLFQTNGAAADDLLGFSVAGAGDVNGDGKADIIIGAPTADPGGILGAGSAFIYGISSAPSKGDMNADGDLTVLDVVLLLNCVFLGTGNCGPSVADLNCDEILTPSDFVIELNAVYLDTPIPCSP